jgi:hypothetical protein
MKDFTDPESKKRLTFRIDDDVFEAVAELPAGAEIELTRMIRVKDEYEQAKMVAQLLDMLLIPESAEVFAKRMSNPANPITSRVLVKVFQWLMETYSGRPTEPPPDSSNGPSAIGTSLTDGVQLVG